MIFFPRIYFKDRLHFADLVTRSRQTEPLFKFILFICLLGILQMILGFAFEKDLVVLSGNILVATCVIAIARLVK